MVRRARCGTARGTQTGNNGAAATNLLLRAEKHGGRAFLLRDSATKSPIRRGGAAQGSGGTAGVPAEAQLGIVPVGGVASPSASGGTTSAAGSVASVAAASVAPASLSLSSLEASLSTFSSLS